MPKPTLKVKGGAMAIGRVVDVFGLVRLVGLVGLANSFRSVCSERAECCGTL